MAALGDEELRQLLTAFGVGSEAELLVRLQRRVERSSISERHMPDMVTLPAAECTSR